MLRVFSAAVFALCAAGMPTNAGAQTYPDKPVRLVVPFAPGGAAGLAANVTMDFMSEYFGQRVVVETKPGAGSAIGTDYVAKQKPDGYTLLFMASDGVSVLPAVKSLPYKVPEDFTYIAGIVLYSYALAINAKLPYQNLQELIAWAKANPGKLRFATSGTGGGAHLAGELFAKTVGIQMLHIPFPGSGPALVAALGGHVEMVIATPSTFKPPVEAGTMRALVVTEQDRHPVLPNTPTMAESGIPNLVISGYYGILGPAGTPDSVVARWREGIQAMLKDPKAVERIDGFGFKRAYLPGDGFKDFIVKDYERWKDVAKSANVVITD